jgi:hypothetical protein
MRTLVLFTLVCFGVALPSGADAAKKKKPDTPDDKLSCKQISGRMQVKIMQQREFNQEKQSSSLSRGIQSGFAATFGNVSHGVDPQGEREADLQKLREFNQRLVDKGCKSYDLDAELAKKEIDDVPAPTVLPPKKAKTKAAASTH